MNEVTTKIKSNPANDAAKDMTVCPKCSTLNRGTALYCKCGTALNNECSHCGARNLITAKTCGKCRVKLL